MQRLQLGPFGHPERERAGKLRHLADVDERRRGVVLLVGASVIEGRFIGAGWNDEPTVKATVTSANCSPGRVVALTVFDPGRTIAQRRGRRAFDLGDRGIEARHAGLPADWPAATTASSASRNTTQDVFYHRHDSRSVRLEADRQVRLKPDTSIGAQVRLKPDTTSEP